MSSVIADVMAQGDSDDIGCRITVDGEPGGRAALGPAPPLRRLSGEGRMNADSQDASCASCAAVHQWRFPIILAWLLLTVAVDVLVPPMRVESRETTRSRSRARCSIDDKHKDAWRERFPQIQFRQHRLSSSWKTCQSSRRDARASPTHLVHHAPARHQACARRPEACREIPSLPPASESRDEQEAAYAQLDVAGNRGTRARCPSRRSKRSTRSSTVGPAHRADAVRRRAGGADHRRERPPARAC